MSDQNLGTFLGILRQTLGDTLDCTHWEDSLLLGYLRTALAFLADHRPELFSETVTIKTAAGKKQKLPEGFKRLVSVCTDTGATPSEAFSGDADVENALVALRTCKNTESRDSHANVQTYTVNEHDPSMFTISPAAEEGQLIEVIVVRDQSGKCISLDENSPFPSELGMALCEYVLYKAMLSDMIESPIARQQAAQHFNNFLVLTQLSYLQDQRQGSGFYAGQTGSGDPSFRSR